jgi:hypothetical protein
VGNRKVTQARRLTVNCIGNITFPLIGLGGREYRQHHFDSLHPGARDYIMLKINRRGHMSGPSPKLEPRGEEPGRIGSSFR